MKIVLKLKEFRSLAEALRRLLRFYPYNAKMGYATLVFTGLGYKTTHTPAVDAGYMEWVDGAPKTRCMGWLRLTRLGEKIVIAWMEKGYKYLEFRPNGWEYVVNSRNHTLPRGVDINEED